MKRMNMGMANSLMLCFLMFLMVLLVSACGGSGQYPLQEHAVITDAHIEKSRSQKYQGNFVTLKYQDITAEYHVSIEMAMALDRFKLMGQRNSNIDSTVDVVVNTARNEVVSAAPSSVRITRGK